MQQGSPGVFDDRVINGVKRKENPDELLKKFQKIFLRVRLIFFPD